MTEDPGDKLKTQEPPEADGPSITNPEVGDEAPMPEATEVPGFDIVGLDGGNKLVLRSHRCSPVPSSRSTSFKVESPQESAKALRNRAHPIRRSLAMKLYSPGLPPHALGTGLIANKSVPFRTAGNAETVTAESWQEGRLLTTMGPSHSMGPEDGACVTKRAT